MIKQKLRATVKKVKHSRQKIENLDKTVKSVLFPERYILAYWARGGMTKINWGDCINPWILSKLSGKTVFHIDDTFNIRHANVYVAIGSILQNIKFENAIVWGAGFMYPNKISDIKPKNITLVRGALTRKVFLDAGIKCPNNYGDPGLLISSLYHPPNEKIYKLGLIPHHVDFYSNPVLKLKGNNDVNIIDITSGIFEVVDEILKCEVIASSSLHGLIIADSFNIPNVWIQISDMVRGKGFKFFDYYSSFKRHNVKPFLVSASLNVRKTIEQAQVNDIDKKSILESFPLKVTFQE